MSLLVVVNSIDLISLLPSRFGSHPRCGHVKSGVKGRKAKRLAISVLFSAAVVLSGGEATAHLPDAQQPVDSVRLEYVPNEIIVKVIEMTGAAVKRQPNLKVLAEDLELPKDLHALNARHRAKETKPLFKNFRQNQQRLKALQRKSAALLTPKDRHIVKRLKRAPKSAKVPDLGSIYKIRFDLEAGQPIEEILAAYRSHPAVEYAELNYIVSINLTPNDPLYPLQWSLNNIGQDYPASGRYSPPPGLPDRDIDAPDAWDKSTGVSDIVVAVVDTGVDYTHRDMDDNMWVNEVELNGSIGVDDDDNGYIDDIYGYDFINEDGDPIDDHGHGTHVSGTIAAEGHNGLDIVGVCWNAKIMGLKFLGSDGRGNTADAVEAFYYVVENGADVVSNSWGGGGYSETMEQAINYAYSRGVAMVASAGNDDSNSPVYPADYPHVISVAATNSNDERAPFSNYGDWVDIAAPGVDVLSLRAKATSLGTTYDAFTTILSGTSMAGPHVSGACAMLLSVDQDVSLDQLENALLVTSDPISPGICVSGRLNLYGAVLRILGPEGNIRLHRDVYSCSDLIEVKLFDTDLSGKGTQEVTLSTDAGDSETLLLTEASTAFGIFLGEISTTSDVLNVEDGTLQLYHGQVITATYYDANSGTGTPATVTDIAMGDCQGPVIFSIAIDAPGPEPIVILRTDEPTTARVLYSQACRDPDHIVATDRFLTTDHAIKLSGVSPETDYFFVVEASDAVGNETIDDGAGGCYAFTTNGPGNIYVPTQYATIQAAIDHSWDGGIVWVADGTYIGNGNRDIEFKGRAITVRSINGPDKCIIDCQGTESEHHRGFGFYNGETPDSVLDGFTITNGYARDGGGIYGFGSRPTIRNCIIQGNKAERNGGGLYNCDGIIGSCTVSGNQAERNGGGLYNCSGVISNCAISGNMAGKYGGAMEDCDGLIANCTISGNTAKFGGGLYNCGGLIANCIIWANRPADSLQYLSSVPLYSCTQNSTDGTGCISSDPCFVQPGYWDQNGTPDDLEDDFWVEGDHHLRTDSPCVDAGNYAYCMSLPCTDLDGGVRLGGAEIDMGCFEAGSSTDTDGDWLSDACEPSHANEPDRDGDEILDGLEFLRGTNPNVFDALGQLNVPADADTIQEALLFSRPGETVALSEGTYYENICIGGRDIILTSTDPNNAAVTEVTIVNGDTDVVADTANGRVITFLGTESTNCQIRGLTITGGCVPKRAGGGVWGGGTLAQLTNCVITGNAADSGGGLAACDGLITDCAFQNNTAQYGGGLVWCNGKVSNCVISGNAANSGGGLAACDGVITSCIISENSAAYNGGGLLWSGGSITNCIVSGNSAGLDGGGLQHFEGPVSNCLISANTAEGSGGGLCNAIGPITSCTISGNSAGRNGGGICNQYVWGYPSPTIINSILWGNTAPSGPEIALDKFMFLPAPTLTVSYTDVQGGQAQAYVDPNSTLVWGPGNMDSDPCFVEPGYWDVNGVWVDGDYHLLASSPCVNAGDPNYTAGPDGTDLDGVPRVLLGRIDMGVYEYNYYVEAAMKFTPQTLNCNRKANCVKARVILPEGFLSEDVDVDEPAVAEPMGLASEYVRVLGNDRGFVKLELAFDREAFCSIIAGKNHGSLEVTVVGLLTTGQYFCGSDTIRVLR